MTTVAVFIALIIGALAGAYIALSWASSHKED